MTSQQIVSSPEFITAEVADGDHRADRFALVPGPRNRLDFEPTKNSPICLPPTAIAPHKYRNYCRGGTRNGRQRFVPPAFSLACFSEHILLHSSANLTGIATNTCFRSIMVRAAEGVTGQINATCLFVELLANGL